MLTGDENIVDIEFAVLWQIKDVFKYAFDVRNGEENVRDGAEAAMREVIGKSNLQYAQTEGRTRIEQDTKDLLQRILDEYGLGVQHRPDPAPAGRSAAGGDRVPSATCRRRAPTRRRTSTRPTPTATRCCRGPRARRKSIIQRAEAYKAQIVARAKGDVQRFTQVYDQYAKAKDITAERLYLETMEEVLRNVNKVLIDKNSAGPGGVLPYLPLPELQVEPAAGTAAAAHRATQPAAGATR